MPPRVAGRGLADWLNDLEEDIPLEVDHVSEWGQEPIRWRYQPGSVKIIAIAEDPQAPHWDPYTLSIQYQLHQTYITSDGKFESGVGTGNLKIPVKQDGYLELRGLNFFKALLNPSPEVAQ